MKNLLILLFLFFCSFSLHAFPVTPRVDLAPGHLCSLTNKDFKELRYREQIPYCKRHVTKKTKIAICKIYGITDRKGYTVDHIIPLSLGGDNSMQNLWCQSKKIWSARLEFFFYTQVKNGDMRQVEAVVRLLGYKYNPMGKDHPPLPPEL